MTSKVEMERPNIQEAWGWYNYGMLIGVGYRRKDAIAAIENHTGKPWSEAKQYMQVRKVYVQVID